VTNITIREILNDGQVRDENVTFVVLRRRIYFDARNFATSQSVFHTLVDTHARAQEHN
jgi:hypothetical protein